MTHLRWMAAAWKELVKGYRVHVDCGVRDIGQLCELATTLQVAGKDPVLCRYHAFGCWKIAEERFSTVASEVRRLEAENALLRVERSIERMQEVVDPVGVAEEKLQEMTRRVVRMRIEAKVAEHELGEYIAKSEVEEVRLGLIRERLINMLMLTDGEEQTMDLAEKVGALDKEVELWKHRATVAEATLKRQKMVGRAVPKEEVFAVIGNPDTWGDEKVLPEPQDHRPLAEAMSKLPDAPDVEEEIETESERQGKNVKLLASEMWRLTVEKNTEIDHKDTARKRADAYEEILDLLVIDEEAWADRLVLINVKNFVKAQNLVIADMRAKANTDFPKEW